MISGMERGKNVIVENEGEYKNKSDIGSWSEELDEHPKKSKIQGDRELGRTLAKLCARTNNEELFKCLTGSKNCNVFSQEQQFLGNKYNSYSYLLKLTFCHFLLARTSTVIKCIVGKVRNTRPIKIRDRIK